MVSPSSTLVSPEVPAGGGGSILVPGMFVTLIIVGLNIHMRCHLVKDKHTVNTNTQ